MGYRRRLLRLWSTIRRGIVPVCGILLTGCTIVEARDAGGVHVSYYPGLAVVRVQARDSMQVVDVKSLGVAVAANEASIGWSRRRYALVPRDRCQLLLWRPTAAAIAQVRDLGGWRAEICTSKGEKQ